MDGSEENDGRKPTATPTRPVVHHTYSSGNGEQDNLSQSTSDKSNSHIIFDLIENRQWEAVVRYLESNPEAAKCRHHIANSIQYNLPLHEACRRQPPLDIIDILLNMYDDAVHTAGHYGFLPLHIACGSGSSHEVVLRLLEVFPAATRCRDDFKESLPLHLAAQWGASEEVLMEVLTTYPEGSLIRDATGKTPWDIAMALPDNETKGYVIATLEIAPVLIATAKSATRRIEHEMEFRIRSVQESHKEFIGKLEQRHEDEKTDFLALEIQFHNDLATEKERNCELAEAIIKLQKEREEMTIQHQHDLQQRLEERQKTFDAQWAKHQEDLQALEKSIDDADASRSVDLSPLDHEENKEEVQLEVAPPVEPKVSTPGTPPVSLETISRVFADYIRIRAKLDETRAELGKYHIKIKDLEDSIQEREEHIKALSSSLEMEQEQRQENITHLRKLEASHKEILQERDERIMALSSSLEMERKQHQETTTHLRQLEVSHKGILQELNSSKNEMNRLRSKSDSQQQHLRDSARHIREQDHNMKNIKSLVAALCQNINEWSKYEEAPWMTDSRSEDGKSTPPRKNGIHHVGQDDAEMAKSNSPTRTDHIQEENCDEINLCDEIPMIDVRETDKIQNVSATFSQKSLKIEQSPKDALSTTTNDQMLSMAWNEMDRTPSDLDAIIASNNTTNIIEAKADEIIENNDTEVGVRDTTELLEHESAPVDQSPHWWEHDPKRNNMNDVNAEEVRSLSIDPDEMMENTQNISAILPEDSCHDSDDGGLHDFIHGVQVSQSVDDEGKNDENLGMEVTVVKTKPGLNSSSENSENTVMITDISNAEADDDEDDMFVVSLVRDFVSIRSIDEPFK